MYIRFEIFITAVLFYLPTQAFCQNSPKVELVNEKLNQFLSVRDFCISTTGDEIYFTIQSPFQEISQIAYMKKIEDKWSDPRLMTFSSSFSDLEPFLSPDQTKLYFASNRPLTLSSIQPKDFDIWYVSRESKNEDWSAPINMGSPINTENDEFYPSVSANNNLYFTADLPTGMGKDDIYVSQFQKGSYLPPQILDKNINSSGYEFNAFISRNEDFLIYTKYNEPGGLGSGDLYISKKNEDGSWSKARNLGGIINTKFMEYCPFYDEKNQILYFTSKRNNIQPKLFKNIEELNQYLFKSENGLSKIYMIDLEIEK